FEKYKKIFEKALLSAQSAGIITLADGKTIVNNTTSEQKKKGKTSSTGTTTSSVSTSTSGFTCPPAEITSFSPVVGNDTTPVTVSGKYFKDVISIELLGQTIDSKDITIFPSGTSLRFTPKRPVNPNVTTGKITLKTKDNQTLSSGTFKYDVNTSGNAAQPNPTQVPVPTPTIANSDKAAFDDARLGISARYVLSVALRNGTIAGRFGITLPLQNQHPATIYLLSKSGVKIKIANFTINNNTEVPANGGNFASKVDNWSLILDEAMQGDDNLVYFYVDVPDVGNKYSTVYSYLPYSCPGEGYDSEQIIDVQEYQDIRKNPCCACYPNGTNGKKRIIDGKQCNESSSNC
ncbi:hypothetical protein EBU94_07805, partial [bacterium]|nr:hypothetical protein [bacterium]